MDEAKPAKSASPAQGPSTEELEERWKEAVDALTESPRNVDLLLKAGQISEQLRRNPEAYTYYRKALTLDPSKSFLVAKLRGLATSAEQKEEVTKFSKRPASFEASLGDLYLYPVRGKGLPVLILGALFLWLARFLVRGGGGIYGLSIAGLATAYMSMFYIDVCHTTIQGEDHLPDWPDPLRVTEFISDVAKFFMANIAAFLPVIAIFLVFGLGALKSEERDEIPDFTMKHAARPAPAAPENDDGSDPSPTAVPKPAPVAPAPPPSPSIPVRLIATVVAMGVFGLIGVIYAPMATLANVVMGSPWTGFNYPFVFRSILSTPKNYLICLVAYFGTLFVVGGAETGARIGNVVILTGFALAFIELYGMTVLMRLLGLFYRMNQAKLGWMAD